MPQKKHTDAQHKSGRKRPYCKKGGILHCKTWPFASLFTAFRRAKGYLLQTVPPLLANRLVINYLQNEATFILNFIHAHNP